MSKGCPLCGAECDIRRLWCMEERKIQTWVYFECEWTCPNWTLGWFQVPTITQEDVATPPQGPAK